MHPLFVHILVIITFQIFHMQPFLNQSGWLALFHTLKLKHFMIFHSLQCFISTSQFGYIIFYFGYIPLCQLVSPSLVWQATPGITTRQFCINMGTISRKLSSTFVLYDQLLIGIFGFNEPQISMKICHFLMLNLPHLKK